MCQFYKKYTLFLLLVSFFVGNAMNEIPECVEEIKIESPETFLERIKLNERIPNIKLSQLTEIKNDNGENVFHVACKDEDVESIQKMIFNLQPRDVNKLLFTRNKDGYLWFHTALQNGKVGFFECILGMYYKSKGRRLQEAIFDNNNIAGNTPLHIAVKAGYTEITEILINNFPDDELKKLLFKKNKHLWTALHVAVLRKRTEITDIILNAAGNDALELISLFDLYGDTPVSYAVCNKFHQSVKPDILKLFIQKCGLTVLNTKVQHSERTIADMISGSALKDVVVTFLVCSQCEKKHTNFSDFFRMYHCKGKSCMLSFCRTCLFKHLYNYIDSSDNIRCLNNNCIEIIEELRFIKKKRDIF